VRLLQPQADAAPPSPRARRERMRALAELGAARLAQGQADAAARAWNEALFEAGELEAETTPMQAEIRAGLARIAPSLATRPKT